MSIKRILDRGKELYGDLFLDSILESVNNEFFQEDESAFFDSAEVEDISHITTQRESSENTQGVDNE